METTVTRQPPRRAESIRPSESQLWKRRDEDPLAREELVVRYMPFAKRLASRYRNGRESFDDLVQVASLGLVNAVNRFDPDHGSNFAAFASPTINGELKRYFRDRVWLIRVPRGLQEEIFAVEKAVGELGAELHRTPTDEEVDSYTGLGTGSACRVASARHERVPMSLDTAVDDDGQSSADRYGKEDANFRLIENTDEIRTAITELGETDRLVLRLRFIEDLTQSEIADRIGCSQMHISRVLRRSIAALTEKMSEN